MSGQNQNCSGIINTGGETARVGELGLWGVYSRRNPSSAYPKHQLCTRVVGERRGAMAGQCDAFDLQKGGKVLSSGMGGGAPVENHCFQVVKQLEHQWAGPTNGECHLYIILIPQQF